jgi:hypothetical protein
VDVPGRQRTLRQNHFAKPGEGVRGPLRTVRLS